jgi:hypothetical protein
LDLTSAAILFVALAALVLAFIAIAKSDTTPLIVVPPVLLGAWAIATLRR